MKRICEVLVIISLYSLAYAGNQSRQGWGVYNDATPTEGAVSVSSTVYSQSAAVNYGVKRIFQDTGATNINYFYVIGSSATVTPKLTLTPNSTYTETDYFGDIFWLAPAGVAASSFTYVSITNK